MTTEDKDTAITPEKVRDLLSTITQGVWEVDPEGGGVRIGLRRPAEKFDDFIKLKNTKDEFYERNHPADFKLIAATPNIARAYLKLHEENARLREALGFYANEENYENGRPIIKSYPADGSNGIVSWVNIMITKGDNGITARNALKEQPK